MSDSLHALERDVVKKDTNISSLKEKLVQSEHVIQENLKINKEHNKLQLTHSNQISALTSENEILKERSNSKPMYCVFTYDKTESYFRQHTLGVNSLI